MGALGLLAETLLFETDPRSRTDWPNASTTKPSASIESSKISSTFHASKAKVPDARTDSRRLIVADAIERIRTSAEQHDVKVDFVEPEANLVVVGDRRQLISAIHALIENAVVYSPRGGLVSITIDRIEASSPMRVRASADRADRDQGQGVGIPPKTSNASSNASTASIPVDRARPRHRTRLSIVRHVAQNHGGNVLVESREGEGSTFTLELPMAH